jgi:hypothetical protein
MIMRSILSESINWLKGSKYGYTYKDKISYFYISNAIIIIIFITERNMCSAMVACINIDVNNLVKDSSSSENDEDCGSDDCSGRRKDNGFC